MTTNQVGEIKIKGHETIKIGENVALTFYAFARSNTNENNDDVIKEKDDKVNDVEKTEKTEEKEEIPKEENKNSLGNAENRENKDKFPRMAIVANNAALDAMIPMLIAQMPLRSQQKRNGILIVFEVF